MLRGDQIVFVESVIILLGGTIVFVGKVIQWLVMGIKLIDWCGDYINYPFDLVIHRMSPVHLDLIFHFQPNIGFFLPHRIEDDERFHRCHHCILVEWIQWPSSLLVQSLWSIPSIRIVFSFQQLVISYFLPIVELSRRNDHQFIFKFGKVMLVYSWLIFSSWVGCFWLRWWLFLVLVHHRSWW